MRKIYIDVTSLLEVNFITGIQRVVRNVILEMVKVIPEQLVLLSYSGKDNVFKILDQKGFLAFLLYGGDKDIFTRQTVTPLTMGKGNIFFDIDSVWNSTYKRSTLLPVLKKQEVKIAVYIYDVIPITDPQFCHEYTIYNFMDYIGAYLQYADILIASAQSTLDEIDKLSLKLGLQPITGFVSWLGSDFNNKETQQEYDIPENVKEVAKNKYVLSVGTIEPRKNHAFLLDAFEQSLFSKGINLVFAGKVGWNVEQFEERMKNSPYYNKQFFHFTGLNDASIDYLYRHAFVLGFPTFNEGFGLPMIEALERGVPVMATRRPVLQEVGRDFCEYFDPHDPQEFIDKVIYYFDHPEEYDNWKTKISTFVPFTWKETSDRIIDALDSLSIENKNQGKQ